MGVSISFAAFTFDKQEQVDTAPIVGLYRFQVPSELQGAYNTAGVQNLTASMANEPNTLSMNVAHVKGNPSESYVVEVYKDTAALETHRKSEHFQNYINEVGSKLTNRKFKRDEMIPAPYNIPDVDVSVGESHEKRVASGYDIGYARTFKNARYIRAYIDRYHWNRMNGEIRDVEWFSNDIYNYNIAFPVNGVYKNGIKTGVNVNVTPHISVGMGYDKPFGHSGEFYVQTMYTLGKSKFALLGGKHSDSSMTTARSKMLDKIERQDMQAINLNGDFHVHYPHDRL